MANLRSQLLCVTLAACSAEVVVVGDHPAGSVAGAGGDGSSTGGAPNGGGGGTAGGAEGGAGVGGSAPLPVVGCEMLVQDQPFVIPEAQRGWIAGIDSAELGFVGSYPSTTSGYLETRSRRLSYGAWPPVMTDEILHDAEHAPSGELVAREDGAFAIRFSQPGFRFGTFGQEGPLLDADSTGYAPLFLEPSPGVGFYAQSYYYPTLEATHSSWVELGGGEANAFGTSGSGDVIVHAGEKLFRVKNGEPELIGPAPPSANVIGIVPRPGGFWLGTFSTSSPMELAAVEDDGTVSQVFRPFGESRDYWLARMAPWRGGVALVGVLYPDQRATLAVTDGSRVTTLLLPELVGGCEDGPMVVAPPDGTSVIVGFEPCDASQQFELLRYRCAAE